MQPSNWNWGILSSQVELSYRKSKLQNWKAEKQWVCSSTKKGLALWEWVSMVRIKEYSQSGIAESNKETIQKES